MSGRDIISLFVAVTLSFMLLGLLSVTAYAAGPAHEDAYQAIPAANHCPGITNNAASSIFLAANPELSTACRYATMLLQQQETASILFPNIAREAEMGQAMSGSTFAAANPEAMRARHYTGDVTNLVQALEK